MASSKILVVDGTNTDRVNLQDPLQTAGYQVITACSEREAVATTASTGDTHREPSQPQVLAPEVLVVDDSLTARRMLTIVIGDAGYRVRTASDGLDAVEAIEDAMPDLLITDLEMPRMNGLELAAHLRADRATQALPILMVTSGSTDKHRGQAQAAGINDFITKPYANQDLLDLVQRSLS